MKKTTAALCLAALLLTACGGEESIPQLSDLEITTVSEAVSETETQAVSETETEEISETEPETETEAISETETETETEATSDTEPETETEATSDTETETEAETTLETENEAETVSDEYKAFYKAKLEEIMNGDMGNSAYFDLFDADNDGVPELFVSLGSFHAAGVEVYTFKDGRFIDFSGNNGVGGSYGMVQVGDNGYILSSYVGMGNEYSSYYRINGDKLEKMLHTSVNDLPDPEDPSIFNTHYYVNDEEVTSDEYSASISEYRSDNWESVGNRNPVNAETIEAVLYGDN